MSIGPGGVQEQKRAFGEQLWLHYYNEALFEKGVITEDERNRMARRIDARSGDSRLGTAAHGGC